MVNSTSPLFNSQIPDLAYELGAATRRALVSEPGLFSSSSFSSLDELSGAAAPPNTNRGVLSTFPHNQTDFILDWLSCTLSYDGYIFEVDRDGVQVPFPDILDDIRFLFGEFELQERNRYRGYTHTALLECGGCIAWHCSNPAQKLLIDLSGSSLASLSAPALELVSSLFSAGAAFTRLDVARDDFDGVLNLGLIEAALRNGALTTRFRSGRAINGFQLGAPLEPGGYTIYVGSDQSAVKVRFYDKKIEQARKGDQSIVFDHWVRCEAQFRSEAAQKLAEGILVAGASGVGSFLAGVFLNYLDFKDPGLDTNKSRWPTSSWWSAFLATSDKVRLGLGRVARTIQEAQRWVFQAAVIVLASLQVVDAAWLDEAISLGHKFMHSNKRHRKRLDDWLSQHKAVGNYSLGGV